MSRAQPWWTACDFTRARFTPPPHAAMMGPMKVICNRGALLEALTVAGNAVAARTPKPILQCVKLSAADDTLSLEIAGDSGTASIRGQDSHFKIFTQKAADFPPVPDFEGEADFTVAGGQLKQLINQTVFATQKEATRYAFNGVLFQVKGKKLSLVATDGRRLAMGKGDLVTDA